MLGAGQQIEVDQARAHALDGVVTTFVRQEDAAVELTGQLLLGLGSVAGQEEGDVGVVGADLAHPVGEPLHRGGLDGLGVGDRVGAHLDADVRASPQVGVVEGADLVGDLIDGGELAQPLGPGARPGGPRPLLGAPPPRGVLPGDGQAVGVDLPQVAAAQVGGDPNPLGLTVAGHGQERPGGQARYGTPPFKAPQLIHAGAEVLVGAPHVVEVAILDPGELLGG